MSIIKAILLVRQILTEHRIEVIICHNPLGAFVGRIAAWLAKTPRIVYFAHGLPCAPAQGFVSWRLRFWTEKLLGRVTDAILVMNSYDEKLCKTRHIIKNTDNVFRIPGMGVDLTRYGLDDAEKVKREVAKELAIPEHQKIVLFVGRLVPEKGVFVLTEAAEKICEQRNDVCFLFAGGGTSMDRLKKIVRANHLEDNFRFLGWRGDIDRLMQIADVFVLPTYYFEGLPVSILEAMACGKPVVATKHRGCEDAVVDGQTGFLIPVKQVDPLVDKLLLLLDDEQLERQMGQAGRQRVEQYFDLGYCTEKIIEALEKAIH